MAKIEAVFNARMKNAYNEALESSDKWADGATRALQKYADEATNAAKNAETVFGNAAQNTEDFLTDMVSSGEFSMKKLGNLFQSIQKDLVRAFIRQNVTGPLAQMGAGFFQSNQGRSMFGSNFSSVPITEPLSIMPIDIDENSNLTRGGIYHEGGIVGHSSVPHRSLPLSTFMNAPRFHKGLMPDEMPAILQRGETVLPKGTRMGGNNITFNITTPNSQSFMESQGQIMNRLGANLSRYRARNG